jgi:hypothetical protein
MKRVSKNAVKSAANGAVANGSAASTIAATTKTAIDRVRLKVVWRGDAAAPAFGKLFSAVPLSQAPRCRPRQATLRRDSHMVFHSIVPIGQGKRVTALW